MSTQEHLSNHLANFILRCFDSIEQIDVALLLFANRERRFSTEEIANELRSNVNSITQKLEALVQHGIVSRSPDEKLYHLNQSNENNFKLVSKLASTYKSHRYKVIDLVFGKNEIAVRNFANAFKFRNEDD